MTETIRVASIEKVPSRHVPLMLGRSFKAAWPLADALVVVALSVASGLAYHWAIYGERGPVLDYAKIGLAVALLRWILQQPVANMSARPQRSLRYQLYLWNAAFLGVIVFAFLAKVTHDYSRGAILLFYAAGLPALLAWQELWTRFVREGLSSGRLAVRKVLLIGTLEKIEDFRRTHRPAQAGLIISDIVVLPHESLADTPAGQLMLKEGVGRAIELVRLSAIEEVLVLLPWSSTRAINACADMLMTAPVTVQLGPEAIFDRFSQVHLSRHGSATMLNLIRPPLTWFEVAVKRAIDIVGSLALLIVIAPLLLVVALLVKFDSPGPIFFQQRRHGFNQRQFKILKFRTMTVTEDGDAVVQAKKNDPRITRLGRLLRRWNIDELPQLLNVLMGEMSLVGPRPHALTHDRDFGRRVAFYARRHNNKPGITGWAQVNGWRGPTDTEEKVQARVEHDLHYIDNWSLSLDLYILALTVLSPKSFRNAY